MNEAKLLTDEQVQTLIASVAYRRGRDKFTEAEATRAIEWAESVLTSHGLLMAVLEGSLAVLVDEDGEATFTMTPKGEARVEAMGV